MRNPKTFTFTTQEAATMAGLAPGQFVLCVEKGLIRAKQRSGRWVMLDRDVWQMLNRRSPMLAAGRVGWVTCGRHVFISSRLGPCPDCGNNLKPAGVLDVVALPKQKRHRPAESVRRCSSCGQPRTMAKWAKVCRECYTGRSNGSRKQDSWDGRTHTCCGSKSNRRHLAGCKNAL